MGGLGGIIFSFFGALDPNLRKGWTEADDAALREAMTDEDIDRFVLARRLGKSMDMVGHRRHRRRRFIISFGLVLPFPLPSPPPRARVLSSVKG